MIDPGDPLLQVTGACATSIVADGAGRRLRLGRPLHAPATGYHWDNPGAAIRLASAGRAIVAHLRYSELHVSATARNGIGLLLVDGAWRPGWTFSHPATTVQRDCRVIAVPLPAPGDGAIHDYDIVLPYGDSVELCGVDSDAPLLPPTARRRPRWAAYGDSVTQGFDASHVGCSYAWRVAQARGWELVNLGIGGRTCTAEDADAIAACAPDLVTIAIGVNDWQCGIDPALYGERLRSLRSGLERRLPRARITVVSPLWVPPSWAPQAATHPLAAYRAAAGADTVDGARLIDHDPALFNRVAVHPNDAGFAQMARRLVALLPG